MRNDECRMMNDELKTKAPSLNSSFRIHHFFSCLSLLISLLFGARLSHAKARILTSVAYVEQHAARLFNQSRAAALDPQHAARAERRAARRDESEQLVGRHARRLLQLEGESRRRPVNRDDARRLCRAAQSRVREESFDGFGQTPVAVFGLAPYLLQRLVVARRRDPLVSPKPLPHVRDIVFGDGNVNAEVYRDRHLVLYLLASKLRDGALQHLCVKIESERVHVPRLLAAQKVPRAA